MANDQLDRLFDYTKFHIGFYATVITGLFAVIGFAVSNSQQEVLRHILPFAWVTALLVLTAGAAGGVIASNIPEYPTFESFADKTTELKVFGVSTRHYSDFVRLEHMAFWAAVLLASAGFLSTPWVRVLDKAEGKTEAVAAAAAPGTVQVTSNPDGADVYSDGSFVGNAPSMLKLAPGKHTVSVKSAGHKDWSRDITVQSGSEVKLNAVMEKQ